MLVDNMYLNNQITQAVMNSQVSNGLITEGKTLMSNKLKSTFGQEFYVDSATENSKFNEKIFNFLQKYDKYFENHYDAVRDSIIPFSTFIVLDPRTFMFVATKHNVPGKMRASIMDDKINADLYIYVFGRRYKKYAKEFEAILDDRDKSSRNDMIYAVNSVNGVHGTDINCLTLQKREMDTLFFSNGEIEAVRDFINRFNNGNTFYKEKQLCYKTGILLYGKPGTGKSSLVKAIATEFHRAIVQIEVSNIHDIDFAHLTMMINNEEDEKYIVLFEDIDTLFLNRDSKETNKDKDYNSIINKLLQFLDSNSSPNDVIFIATTNHLERLDDALIREGRFDLKLEVDEIVKEDVTRFIETFDLDASMTDEIIDTYRKKKKQDAFDRYIKKIEIEKNEAEDNNNNNKRLTAEEKEAKRKDFEKEYDDNYDRYNQSLMQNVIMSYINHSDKIESVVDTAEVDDKKDDED